jgi:hypothetical protein
LQRLLRNISALFLLCAPLLLAWRVWNLFPVWLMGLLLSASMSALLLFILVRQDKSSFEELQAQNRLLDSELKQLRPLPEELRVAKERADCFQCSLEQTLDELRNLRTQMHFDSETTQAAHLIKYQHLQLRKQFEEKGEKLAEARRAHFELEGRYLVLEREKDQQALERRLECEVSEELAAAASEETAHLQAQVEELEELVTHLSSKKKATGRKPKKPVAKDLEFQF